MIGPGSDKKWKNAAHRAEVVRQQSQSSQNVVPEMSLSCPKIIPKLVSRHPDVVSKLFQSYLKVMQRFSQSFQKLSRSFLEVFSKLPWKCFQVVQKFSQNWRKIVSFVSKGCQFLSCAIHIFFEICVSHRLQTTSTSLRSTSKIQVLSKLSNDHWLSLTTN